MSSPTLSRQRPSARQPRAAGGAPAPHCPAEADGARGGVCIDVPATAAPRLEAERIRALEAEVEQLKAAMASRASIEQAKGILMLLTGCGEQVAFDLLAHISSHTHRKVRDVAQSITESARGTTKLPDDVGAIIRDACPPAPAHR